jgi:hypothetical protein
LWEGGKLRLNETYADFEDFPQARFNCTGSFGINSRISHQSINGRIFMMPSFDRYVRSLACFILLLGAACERPQNSDLDAYISRDDDRWTQNPITVCFEQAHGYVQDRAIIKQVISTEYARADIYFEGWDTCLEDDQGIRISFDENAGMSQTKEIGKKNAGLTQNLLMGFKSRCSTVFSGSVCESNIALHEFGHALGLHHEMNRRDNQSCTQDQTVNEDAMQLGPYDTRSVMDYCFLYAANDKLEALHLSEQDVAALKALNSGLVASLDHNVPRVVEDTWTGYVQGRKLHTYRYALGPKDSLACNQLSSYSQSLPLHQPIQIDPRAFSSDPKTVMTLCLLGENAAGQQQDVNTFSAIDFHVVSPTTIASPESSALALTQQPIMYRQNQLVILEIDIGAGLPLRSLYASLEYTQSSIYRHISNARFESKDLGFGRYQLFFKAEDFPANGQVYVSTLELTNVRGQKLSLFSSAAWTPFFDQTWNSPALWVDWSFENDGQGPILRQITSFPQELEARSKASFTMEIEENSRLQAMRMVLRSDHNSFLEPVLKWQWLHDQTYQIDLEIPQRTVNGYYRLDSLSIEDIMDNRSYYSLDASSNLMSDTKVPAPALVIKNGIPYESNPPELRGVLFSSSHVKRKEKAFVDLDIVDESSIKQVNLSLRHVSDQGFYKTIYGIDLGEVGGKRRIELNTTEFHPQGEFTIQDIIITDRFGHSNRYELDPNNPGQLIGGLTAGTIELIDP